jgi:CRISPR-associated Csx2 family protein
MANRRVFISFLGSSFYGKCKYSYGEFTSSETRFVQQATLEWINAKEKAYPDVVTILLTEGDRGSRATNWNSIGTRKTIINRRVEKESDKTLIIFDEIEEEYIGLEKILSDMSLKVSPIDIPDGKDEKEIWQIFKIVFEQMQEGDHLYFDLTHGFRYLPMLLLVLGNYAKYLKKDIQIKHISYGNFEARNGNIAPFVDLMPLVTLQQITSVADAFTQSGKISKISSMIAEKANVSGTLSQIQRALDKLDVYILTNRMDDIRKGQYFKDIKDNLNKVYASEIPEPEKIVFKKMQDELKEFVAEESDKNILAAINWAFRYGMLTQAYTMAQEHVITLVCNELQDKNPYASRTELKLSEKNKKFRTFISSLLGINNKDAESHSFKNEMLENRDLSIELLSLELIQSLRQSYKLLADNRNTLNHAKGGGISMNDLKKQFESSFNDCLKILTQNETL